MDDEIWTMRDGTRIAVGDMSESHVRNTLRMILRKRRLKEKHLVEHLFDIDPLDMCEPDNHQKLTHLRQQHGDRLRVESKSVAGMEGGDVYVNGEWIGWYGGISA